MKEIGYSKYLENLKEFRLERVKIAIDSKDPQKIKNQKILIADYLTEAIKDGLFKEIEIEWEMLNYLLKLDD